MKEESGRKAVRTADNIVNYVLVAVLAVLFLLGCYSLWDSHLVYDRADATEWQPYKPTEPEPISFRELQQVNPDVRAWLQVYGTHIDYPVCQGEDLDKYLTTDAKGEYSLSGSLFMDPEASPDFTDFANFVYGHHMEQDVMFGQLTDFQNAQFFREHRYGDLYVNETHFGIEFFCYLDADAYDRGVYRQHLTGDQNEADYVQLLHERAVNWRDGVEVGPGDRLIVLSTCSSGGTNERSLLVGKICDQTFENTFRQIPNYGTGVDSGWGWLGVPWWVWAVLGLFLILLAALLVARWRKRSNAGKRAS